MHGTSTPQVREHGITLVELLVAMIVLGVVTTLLLVSWTSLQKSYAHSVKSNNARAEARDAMARMSREIRDAQPAAITSPPSSPFTQAGPYEVTFYSAFNSSGVRADGSGMGALRLTRIYLDTSGGAAQKRIVWQRDTNDSGSFDGADRTIVLARDVVNSSVPSVGSPTPVFTYGYRDASGEYQATTSVPSADLGTIVSVHIHLIVDANLVRAPAPADLQTTVLPRNAPQR